MDYSAANNEMWSLILQLGILALALGAAMLLLRNISFLRRAMIPTAVLAGFLLLVLRETGILKLDEAILEMLVYHTIGLGFIAMSLRRALRPKGKDGKRGGRATGLKSGAIIVGTYLVQALTGLAVSMGLSLFMPRVFRASGLLLPMGFGQGPGQANNIGSTYESMGFAGGRSYGLAIAAAGYLCACTVGVLILRAWSVRTDSGKAPETASQQGENSLSMFREPNEIPVSDSIDRFSVQFVMVLGVYLVTYLVTLGITSALAAVSPGLADTLSSLLWGFNFIIGSALALLFGRILDRMTDKGFIHREYRNNYLLSRLSGLFFDLMITAGIASIRIQDISGLWLPFLLSVVLGAAVTWFFLKWAAGQAYPDYTREGLISMYGMLTGTIGSGILLLRQIDPELKTPAANNLVIGSSYGIVLGAPLLVFVSLAARSTLMCLITFGLAAVYLVGLSLLIRRRIRE
ncbi:MAG: hypothetical protein IKP22_01325 [Clostridia bacterium]|nr:hypothetical protein [Clostridia bacterium]